MSRTTLRKLAATGLGAALIGSGLTVGLGAGVASADTANCKTSQSTTENATVGKFTYERSVSGGGEVAADGTITFTSKFSVTGLENPYINTIIDYGPDNFVPVEAWVTAKQAGEKRNKVAFAAEGDGVKVNSSGWSVTSGDPVTLEMTYKAPATAKVGDVFNTGVEFKGTVGSSRKLNPMDVCATIRGKNPIEAATGSLDDIGLGSVNTGSSNIFGSATDPAGSVGNIVDGIDVGKIFGDLLKSGS